MRKLSLFGFIGVASTMLLGCATSMPVGGVYTDVKLPVTATADGGGTPKVGTAECMSVLAMVATGDCSIEAAKKNGGITKVYHVDWEANNILGIIGKYKVVVHGQ
jgi:hypothetical protein